MAMDLVVTDMVVTAAMDTVVLVMDLEVLDLEVIDMAGLEGMGSEVMLILFILKPTLHNHPIKLRRKFMPNLNKPIVNLKRMHSRHKRMLNRNKHMPHRNKRMRNLNKRMHNLKKPMRHLSKRMLNPNRRTHSLNRPMYLKHIAKLKHMHLNKRTCSLNKHMLNQQPHTQRLRSLHIKIKPTASNLKSVIRNNLFTKRVDIFKNPFKDIMMQQPLLVEIELTIFYQLFISYVIKFTKPDINIC